MGEVKPKRPTPITVVAVLWFIFGIYNIWVAFQGISSDIGVWDLLSSPFVHEWIKMAIPAELVINIVLIVAAIFQILAVPALLTGKSWSYKLALGVPIVITILNLVTGALYASAPAEFSELLGQSVVQAFLFGVIQMIAVFFFWNYLNKPEVKVFLGLMQPQATTQEKTVVPMSARCGNCKYYLVPECPRQYDCDSELHREQAPCEKFLLVTDSARAIKN